MTPQRAFTLLEVVVTMVLATILAVAGVVTYQKVSGNVHDKKAQTVVTAIVGAERTHEKTRGSFTDDPATLKRIEGAYTYTDGSRGAQPGGASVGLVEGPTDQIVLAVASPSESGNCFGSVLSESADTTISEAHWTFPVTASQPCTAQVVAQNVGSNW